MDVFTTFGVPNDYIYKFNQATQTTDTYSLNTVTHNIDNLSEMMREAVHSREIIETTRTLYLQQQIPLLIIIAVCIISLTILLPYIKRRAI